MVRQRVEVAGEIGERKVRRFEARQRVGPCSLLSAEIPHPIFLIASPGQAEEIRERREVQVLLVIAIENEIVSAFRQNRHTKFAQTSTLRLQFPSSRALHFAAF